MTLSFRTAGVSYWPDSRPAGRTAGRPGATQLDQALDNDYGLIPLHFPDPDQTDLPAAAEYARYVNKFFDEPHGVLLDRLSEEHGLMWLTIAKVARVSVPALRKWRNGGRPIDPNKLALSRLLAACDQLAEMGLSDVAAWLNAPILLGQNRQRVELLKLDQGGETLLSLAQDTISPQQALDVLDATWRDRAHRPTSEVAVDADGYGTVHIANA